MSPANYRAHRYIINTIKVLLFFVLRFTLFKPFTSGTVLPKGAKLQFFPIHRLHPPYTVKWQITNTGEEARAANGLRGDRFENAELYRGGILCGKKEETSYSGTHYIQCFIIKNGNQCMAYSNPFVVKIR